VIFVFALSLAIIEEGLALKFCKFKIPPNNSSLSSDTLTLYLNLRALGIYQLRHQNARENIREIERVSMFSLVCTACHFWLS
jgi:hypothetical protein